MKRLLLAATLFLSFGAHANSNDCSKLADEAANMMQARQHGVQIQTVLNAHPGNPMWEQMAFEAFQTPLLADSSYLDMVVDAFSKKHYALCMSMYVGVKQAP